MNAYPIDPRPPGALVEARARSFARWRTIFLVVMVVVPALLYALFERQARRLDALADHGASGVARVVAVTRQNGATYVDYAYEVGGASYRWSVSRAAAPFDVGQTFPIVYVPEDPSLSRPGGDRSIGAREAAHDRRFSRIAVGVVFVFLALCAAAAEASLRRIRRTGTLEVLDPAERRKRMITRGAILVVLVGGVSAAHAVDATQKGESLVPVVLAAVLALAVVGGVFAYALRGRDLARVARWAGLVAAAIATIRAIVWLAGAG
jgi:hypothetical protein